MVQLDAIRVDLPATLKAVQALYANREAHVEQEAALLRESGACAVVCDVPALPLEAARRGVCRRWRWATSVGT